MNLTTTPAPASSVVADLRALLLLRFPASHAFNSHKGARQPVHGANGTNGDAPTSLRTLPPGIAPTQYGIAPPSTLPTGIAAWDEAAGGLRLGEVTEICGSLGGTGLVMDRLLEASAAAGWLGAWVDAGDALEVEDWNTLALRRILWVRCRNPLMALKSADLLLRDGNLSWVTLDLQAVSETALRRISGQHWHRFHRLVAHHGNALLVLSPSPMVEGAKVRVLSRQPWPLESLNLPRRDLLANSCFEVFVRGRQPGGAPAPAPELHPAEIQRMTA